MVPVIQFFCQLQSQLSVYPSLLSKQCFGSFAFLYWAQGVRAPPIKMAFRPQRLSTFNIGDLKLRDLAK